MRTVRLQLLLAAVLAWPGAALGQRVLECRFVSVVPSSFEYGKWSFAADISGGHLAMLLVRPSGDGEPYLRRFTPLGRGESVFHELVKGESGSKADFVLARLGPDNQVSLDEWSFGDSEEYARLILACPSHP